MYITVDNLKVVEKNEKMDVDSFVDLAFAIHKTLPLIKETQIHTDDGANYLLISR